ncbi:MAG: hypothetical protein HY738_14285, partial [Bacteroidia bacterium]|nr:hypothetical protein [Bacteroidia bacterium]
QEKKLELLDWILHVNDENILNNIERIRLKFTRTRKKDLSNSPEFGRLKGQIIMSPDFNEPLDDFKTILY